MAIGLLYAAFTGFCWAILAIGLKHALHFSSSGTIVWMRMVFAFGLVLAVFALRSPKTLKKIFLQPPKLLIFAGLMLAVNYFAYMHGLELTSAANAQIMIQLGPLMYLMVGVFYFREKLTWQQWCGIAIAFSGFSLFYWDQAVIAFADPMKYLFGNLWIFLGACTWAIFAAIQKYLFTKDWKPQEQNLLVYGLSLIGLLPLATMSEIPPMDGGQWFLMFLLGLNTMLAYGAFAEANRRAPASYVSLIIACNPLLTIFILKVMEHFGSSYVTPEPIAARGYLGAFFVVLGVGLAVSMRKQMKAPPSPNPLAPAAPRP